MAGNPQPFEDVIATDDGFSLPELKWRELLFIGALRTERDVPQTDGATFVRDPSRPLPPFRIPDLFPEGVRFRASLEGRRVVLRRLAG